MTTVGVVGLGYWGPNLARNFDDLGTLRWLCDADPEIQARFAARYPHARVTADLDDLHLVLLRELVEDHARPHRVPHAFAHDAVEDLHGRTL